MSLKRNIIASYGSQAYVTIIGIVMVPLYIRYMGTEAYGLVGFYGMLQAWFQLLDVGLTPTISRETARFNAGALDALTFRRLFRSLEGVFFCAGAVGCAALMLLSGLISTKWLHGNKLPADEIQRAVILISVVVALRWVGALYRGVSNGFEQIVWLSQFNSAIATARFILVLPVLAFVGATPDIFFGYQFLIAIVEVLLLVQRAYSLLPRSGPGQVPWQWAPLRSVLKFSLSIAFTSSVWILVTQTDKLLLSKLLPLTEYGYFTLGVLVASGVSVISGPISGSLLPRLAGLSASGDDAGLVRLYRNATQLVTVVAVPTAAVLAAFSQELLWAWTGNLDVARQAAPVLTLYAAGNGFLALGAFPYYLQYARGELRLHLIGSVLFIAVLIPSLIIATAKFGIIGAGYAWLSANVVYFVVWVPVVHRRFFRELHRSWLLKDVVPSAASALVCVVALRIAFSGSSTRIGQWIILLGVGLISLMVTALGSSRARLMLRSRFGRG